MKKLSPYLFLSDMHDESREDMIYEQIILMCMDITGGYDIESVDVEYALSFCSDKIEYLNNLNKSFGLKIAGGAFSRIGHDLSMITCSDELSEFNKTSIYVDLASNVDNTINTLYLCEKILTDYMLQLQKGET